MLHLHLAKLAELPGVLFNLSTVILSFTVLNIGLNVLNRVLLPLIPRRNYILGVLGFSTLEAISDVGKQAFYNMAVKGM